MLYDSSSMHSQEDGKVAVVATMLPISTRWVRVGSITPTPQAAKVGTKLDHMLVCVRKLLTHRGCQGSS